MSNSRNEINAIILRSDVSFTSWSSDLRGALAQDGLVGYVFHDHPGIRAKKPPIFPQNFDSKIENEVNLRYLDQLEAWTTKNLQAYSIILRRLDSSTRPESNNTKTSKELYDVIANTHKPSAGMPYRNAYKKLLSTKFTTTATDFCNNFQRNLQNFRNAATNLETMAETSLKFTISDGMASIMFFEGTSHISWLETWMATGALDINQQSFAPLDQMMATLRAVSGDRLVATNPGPEIVAAAPRSQDPDSQCYLHPNLKHKNKECRTQHPELREVKRNTKNGRANAAAAYDDNSDFDIATMEMTAYSTALPVMASASGLAITKDSLIWDSGASRHFVNNRSAFTNLRKLKKPFTFDQAVHKSSLNYGGTALVKLGSLEFRLNDALYSPESSINLISAG
ncbi:hypothetical protein K3495_g8358 [Podosphaera aphanis]|nr:hypothetical protein K3495_g8358 [Podosphaera aphanis]